MPDVELLLNKKVCAWRGNQTHFLVYFFFQIPFRNSQNPFPFLIFNIFPNSQWPNLSPSMHGLNPIFPGQNLPILNLRHDVIINASLIPESGLFDFDNVSFLSMRGS